MVKRRHIRAWGDGYDGYILAKHDILWLFLDKQERICTWLEIYLWDHSSFKRKPQCGGGRSCTSLGAIKIAPETKGFSLFTGRYLAGHQNLLVFFWWRSSCWICQAMNIQRFWTIVPCWICNNRSAQGNVTSNFDAHLSSWVAQHTDGTSSSMAHCLCSVRLHPLDLVKDVPRIKYFGDVDHPGRYGHGAEPPQKTIRIIKID